MKKEKKLSCFQNTFLALLAAAAVGTAAYEFYVHENIAPYFADGPWVINEELEYSQEIMAQVMADLEALEGKKVAIYFYPGGRGNTSLAEDPFCPEIIEYMKAILEEKDFSTGLIEVERIESVWEGLSQSRPSVAAQKAALRHAFVARARPDLIMILIGRSNGASTIKEVMRLLENNEQIFAIEINRPMSNGRGLAVQDRTLEITNQGDAIAQGDWSRLLRANLPPEISLGEDDRPDFQAFGLQVTINKPDHDITWEQVADDIEPFLQGIMANPGVRP